MHEQLKAFAEVVEREQRDRYAKEYPGYAVPADLVVAVHVGKKYARVDVGTSGKYMVELETGDIFGIKGYGVVHRGHRFGNLSTVGEFDWSGYSAVRRR